AVITGDTHGSIVEAIRHYIWPRIAGHDVANLNQLTRLIQGAMEKNLSAKAAVEIALYDLWGQLYGAPLYKLLGGGDPLITTDITISVDYIDKMVADSLAAVDRGFESLKIKVGKDIGVDIERVKAIYAAVEDRALLRLDVNQGWTAKQAVYALKTLEDAGVKLELGAAGQGAGPGRHALRDRARAHAHHGRRERVRSDPGDRVDPHARRRHHQHQAHEDRWTLQCHSHRRHRLAVRGGVHDRLHARDQHQRGGGGAPGGGQVQRDHQ